jgi:hypothetical protein
MLVAHEVRTGLALRPQWGPVNGSEAVSEQGLLEKLIDRLPAAAVVIGDANFGVFSVAWIAQQRSHPVLLRMTESRARRLAGAERTASGRRSRRPVLRRIRRWTTSTRESATRSSISHVTLFMRACIPGHRR